MNRKKFLQIVPSLAIGLSGCNSKLSSENKKDHRFEREHYWKMLTTWPPNFPILGEVCERFSNMVSNMSGGRMEIKVFGAGELVPALESFEAVKIGIAEIGNGSSYYWAGKIPAAQFFSAVPFGMNAQMLNTWLLAGGGMKLWEELYEAHNLIPIVGGNTGVQMGGWFNKKIDHIDDLNGLKIRMPGLGGKVITRAGATSVLVAGGEIYTSLERGIIDATEWIGPYHDYLMGFHKVSKYYYSPGWHECGTSFEFVFNKEKFYDLPTDLQEILKSAVHASNLWVLSQFEHFNASYLRTIKNSGQVEFMTWPRDVLNTLRVVTREILEEETSKNDSSKKVFQAYSEYLDRYKDWSRISEASYFQL
jgi:TRAP-type mannitol/chloroaromatic compound transport system substrate-binding protein